MGQYFMPPHRSTMQVRYCLAPTTAVKVFTAGSLVAPHQSETSRVSRSRPRALEFGSIRLRNYSGVYLLGPEEFGSFLKAFGQLRVAERLHASVQHCLREDS